MIYFTNRLKALLQVSAAITESISHEVLIASAVMSVNDIFIIIASIVIVNIVIHLVSMRRKRYKTIEGGR